MKHCFFALAIFLAGVNGCGGEPRTPPTSPTAKTRDAGAGASDATTDAGDPLATDPQKLAPGMREVLRSDVTIAGTSPTTVAIPTNAEADVCVRVAVRPTSVRVKLVAKSGVLAEGATIGEKGPVCVRKGDTLSVELAADPSTKARIVVWSSP